MTQFITRFRRPALAAALLAATAMAGIAGQPAAPAFAQPAHTAPIDVGPAASQTLPGFADLVQKVSPAVVTITTTMQGTVDEDAGPSGEFGRFMGRSGPVRRPVAHALGSGFIIDAEGHIVTNMHVVKDATDIEVSLADGRKLPARLVGADPKTDLAVLQLTSGGTLPHLALGDSDAVRVGDWVVAVGNPFGLGGTVTSGILSARGRQIGEGPYDDFLQIDAPINRGNSGGPLFAQDGSVIGVNTAIFSPSGGSVGIGFAIPSRIVKDVVSQLESSGRVARGWMGVSAQAVTPAMARALHLPQESGALVAEVQTGSPAAAAGMQPGDVITRIGAQAVRDPSDLARQVAGLKAGASQQMTVERDGRDTTLTVDVAAQPGEDAQAAASPGQDGRLGLALAPLDARTREGLNVPDGQRGVVISDVKQGSPAEQAGLRAGDVLESVASHAVTTPQEAARALRDGTRHGGAVALRVLRDGRQAFVALSASSSDAG